MQNCHEATWRTLHRYFHYTLSKKKHYAGKKSIITQILPLHSDQKNITREKIGPLPLRSMCKGKGKGVGKGESRKEKKKGKGKAGGKGEKRKEGRSERRREKGKRIRRKEKGEGRKEKGKGFNLFLPFVSTK